MVENITAEFKEYSGLDIQNALIRQGHKWQEFTFYTIMVKYQDCRYQIYSAVIRRSEMFRMILEDIVNDPIIPS
jgi:hypothetical protein